MPSEVLGGRYADALLRAIGDTTMLEEISEELRAMARVVETNAQFRAFLEGPNVPTDKKHALVAKAFKGKVHQIVMDFVALLLDKHRIDHLGEAAKQFQRLVEERRNQLRVNITTAFTLPVDMADRLKRALDQVTGKDCILESKVDPGVIGGVVAIIGDRVIDGSVRTSLADMRKELLDAVV